MWGGSGRKGNLFQGILPIVAYMRRLCLKGVPFSGNSPYSDLFREALSERGNFQGVLPITAYTGRLCSKGVTFSGNTPYSGLYREALPERGTFFRGCSL